MVMFPMMMVVVKLLASLTGRQRRTLSTPGLSRMPATGLTFADPDPAIARRQSQLGAQRHIHSPISEKKYRHFLTPLNT